MKGKKYEEKSGESNSEFQDIL